MDETKARWPGSLPSALEPGPKGSETARAQGGSLLLRGFSVGH